MPGAVRMVCAGNRSVSELLPRQRAVDAVRVPQAPTGAASAQGLPRKDNLPWLFVSEQHPRCRPSVRRVVEQELSRHHWYGPSSICYSLDHAVSSKSTRCAMCWRCLPCKLRVLFVLSPGSRAGVAVDATRREFLGRSGNLPEGRDHLCVSLLYRRMLREDDRASPCRVRAPASTRFVLRSLRRLFSNANAFSRSSVQAELPTRCHSIVKL